MFLASLGRVQYGHSLDTANVRYLACIFVFRYMFVYRSCERFRVALGLTLESLYLKRRWLGDPAGATDCELSFLA